MMFIFDSKEAMMESEHKVGRSLVWLLIAVLLLDTAAQATYDSTYLAASNYGANGWEGRRPYTQNDIVAYVEYAVYDRNKIDFPSVFGDVGSGQYIYAYQAFNINTSPTAESIATFELLITGKPSATSGITSKEDITDISSKDIKTNHEIDTFKWTFETGMFIFDKHSWLMVFSSDSGPVQGDFKLTTQDNGAAPPTPDVPEPATLAMLAVGMIGLMRKRKTQKS
jgi:hypothetical protein